VTLLPARAAGMPIALRVAASRKSTRSPAGPGMPVRPCVLHGDQQRPHEGRLGDGVGESHGAVVLATRLRQLHLHEDGEHLLHFMRLPAAILESEYHRRRFGSSRPRGADAVVHEEVRRFVAEPPVQPRLC
jgi:hypothetical protein